MGVGTRGLSLWSEVSIRLVLILLRARREGEGGREGRGMQKQVIPPCVRYINGHFLRVYQLPRDCACPGVSVWSGWSEGCTGEEGRGGEEEERDGEESPQVDMSHLVVKKPRDQ